MQDPDDQRTPSAKLVAVASLEHDTRRVGSPADMGEENAEMEQAGFSGGSSFTVMEVRDAGGLQGDWELGDEFRDVDGERGDQEFDVELIDRDESRRQVEPVTGGDGITDNEDDVDEDVANDSLNADEPGPRKKRKSFPPPKEKISREYTENYTSRAQKAYRRGKKIEESVKDYISVTGAKAYFKGLFEYKNGSRLRLEAGEDFELPVQEGSGEPPLKLSDIQESVKQAVVQSFTNFVQQTTTTPTVSTSATAFSPGRNMPPRLNPESCRICRKRTVSEGLIQFSSAWILCAVGRACNYRVHANCLGFPGMSRGKARQMPKFYCEQHRQQGRQREEVTPMFEGADGNGSGASASGRGRGAGDRGTRRSRGRRGGRT